MTPQRLHSFLIALGLSPGAIKSLLQNTLALCTNPVEDRKAAILAERLAGTSASELAEKYNLSRSHIYKLTANEDGVPHSRWTNPEKATAREKEIIEARRRRESLRSIATRFGISAERVRQIEKRYIDRTGEKLPDALSTKRVRKSPNIRARWVCASCGEERLVYPYKLKNAPELCWSCFSKTRRQLSSEAVKKAIRLRVSGLAWADICREIGADPKQAQIVQRRIWNKLRKEGRLNIGVADRLFGAGRYNWLLNKEKSK